MSGRDVTARDRLIKLTVKTKLVNLETKSANGCPVECRAITGDHGFPRVSCRATLFARRVMDGRAHDGAGPEWDAVGWTRGRPA